jgi:hypothetical protein
MSSRNKIRTIYAPKRFRASSITTFINDCSPIFSLPGAKETGFLLDLKKVSECAMIGMLLTYKMIEFSIKNDCFSRPAYLMGEPFQKAMEKYGFTKLILTYLGDREVAEKEFAKLKVSVQEEFIIAPQALLRNDKYSSEKLKEKYLPEIQKYYAFNQKSVSMILTCFCEIFLNFWQHAEDDSHSIIVASGNKKTIEIGCADNGKGILTTLTKAGKEREEPVLTFISALEKGVTSKDMSNHMGYGLWIVDQITKRTGGRLHLYSEGYYYQREFGKVKHGKCGYWKGTVVYLSLPTDSPATLSDIEELKEETKNLQINWS